MSTLDAVDFLPRYQEVFYDPGMAIPDSDAAATDAILRHNDAEDVAGRIGALEAEQGRVFLHLRKARCYVAGTVVEHDSLRIRLSDVSAWTVAGVTESSAEPSLVR
jgi:hypothetical protein